MRKEVEWRQLEGFGFLKLWLLFRDLGVFRNFWKFNLGIERRRKGEFLGR